MIGEINRMDRIFLRLSHSGAPLERSLFALMRAFARHFPATLAERSGAPEPIAAQVGAAVAEGLLNTGGVVCEYQLLDRPWGFDPSVIAVPTHIWQGTADDLVPAGWAQRLARAISGSELILVPGGSHLLWYDHWEEILGVLAARSSS